MELHNIKKGIFYKFTSKHLLLVYLFGIIFCLVKDKIHDPDIWWHLRTGQYIVETKGFPLQNVFSYIAADHHWIAYSWLTEVIFYSISLLGLNWLIIFKGILIVITFILVFKTACRECRGNISLAVLITFLMAYISSGSWLERPQLFSFLFTALFVNILRRFDKGEANSVWILPFIMLFWVNLHIYFVVGIILILVYLFSSTIKSFFAEAEEKSKEINKKQVLLRVTVASFLVCMINPYTYRIFTEVFRLSSEQWARTVIVELQSPNFHFMRDLFFEFMLFLCVFSFSISNRRISLIDSILFFGFTYQALYSVRDLPFWSIVVTPILCSYLGDFSEYIKNRQNLYNKYKKTASKNRLLFFINSFLKRFYPILNWFLVGILLGVIVNFLPVEKKFDKCVNKKEFPVDAVRFIKENNLPGRMFNPFNWGGYLIYTLYPDWKVSIDGRTQSYGDVLLKQYDSIHSLHLNWEKNLEKYEANFIIWDYGTPFTQILLLMEEWKLIYVDDVSMIFIKNSLQNKTIIKKYNQDAKKKLKKTIENNAEKK